MQVLLIVILIFAIALAFLRTDYNLKYLFTREGKSYNGFFTEIMDNFSKAFPFPFNQWIVAEYTFYWFYKNEKPEIDRLRIKANIVNILFCLTFILLFAGAFLL